MHENQTHTVLWDQMKEEEEKEYMNHTLLDTMMELNQLHYPDLQTIMTEREGDEEGEKGNR